MQIIKVLWRQCETTLSPKDTSLSSHTGEVCPDCICGIFLFLLKKCFDGLLRNPLSVGEQHILTPELVFFNS